MQIFVPAKFHPAIDGFWKMDMTIGEFKKSLELELLPPGISVYLHALWFDAKGDWTRAHHLVDHLDDRSGCRVHAYLHRKEGDLSNAQYWYRKTGIPIPVISLTEEWEQISKELLEQQGQ